MTGQAWALAEGEQGGPRGTDTYVLIANASASRAAVRVTLLREVRRRCPGLDLDPTSRFNVYPPAHFAAQFPSGAWRRFGVLVESLGETPAQIVVERAMYSNALGRTWVAGTTHGNAVAVSGSRKGSGIGLRDVLRGLAADRGGSDGSVVLRGCRVLARVVRWRGRAPAACSFRQPVLSRSPGIPTPSR